MTYPNPDPLPPPPPPEPATADDQIFAVAEALHADLAAPQLPPMPPVPPFVAARRRLAELGVGPLYAP